MLSIGYLNDNNTCVCLEYNESFKEYTLERCRVQMNNNLTVVVLTKNEEKNIVAVVQNAKQAAAEVLIVDSGSTDNTVELAEMAGVGVETVRFYQRKELLREPKTNGTFRTYTEADAEKIIFIKKAQELGFSLAEIKELFEET